MRVFGSSAVSVPTDSGMDLRLGYGLQLSRGAAAAAYQREGGYFQRRRPATRVRWAPSIRSFRLETISVCWRIPVPAQSISSMCIRGFRPGFPEECRFRPTW